jgi:hypothetical protein
MRRDSSASTIAITCEDPEAAEATARLESEAEDRRARYRCTLGTLTSVSLAVYCAIIIWGVSTTYRPGIPTLSRMLADNVAMTALFGTCVAMFGSVRTVLVYHYTKHDRFVVLHAEYGIETLIVLLLGAAQIVLFLLVTYITLDVNEVGHTVCASLAVGVSIARELFLYRRRWLYYRPSLCRSTKLDRPVKPGGQTRRWWRNNLWFFFVVDILMIISLMVISIIFAVMVSVESTYELEGIGLMEYFIFGFVIWLTAFHGLDVHAGPVFKIE